VVGSKSVSSRRIRGPAPVEDYAAVDGSNGDDAPPILRPCLEDADDRLPLVVTALSADQTWQALVTVHVYPRRVVGSETPVHSRVAEVWIQVVPATAALSSSDYRESHWRVVLPAVSLLMSTNDEADEDDKPRRSLEAVFSGDKRFLLLFLPEAGDLILLQLRQPRTTTLPRTTLPRPTYLAESSTSVAVVLPVATQPKLVVVAGTHAGAAVTAVARGPDEHLFWIGTARGSIHVLAGRSLKVSPALQGMEWMCSPTPTIQQLDWIASPTSADTRASTGRLAVLDGRGQLHILSTRFAPLEKENNTHTSHATVVTAPPRNKECVPRVLGLHAQEWTTLAPSTAVHALQWLTPDALVVVNQSSHVVTLTVWSPPVRSQDWYPCISNVIRKEEFEGLEAGGAASPAHGRPAPTLAYDAVSESLFLRAAFVSSSDDENLNQSLFSPFSCIWSWRTNVQGWKSPTPSGGVWTVARHEQTGVAKAILTWWTTSRLRKETYDLAVLSPPSNRSGVSGTPNALVLAESSMWYPHLIRSSGQEQLEWIEVPLPADYKASYGVPTLAATGQGDSLAVAARRGMLVWKSRNRRWHRFSNSLDEGQVHVLAMAWWESLDLEVEDTLLVALVRILDDSGTGATFLSCWSTRFFDSEKQLLIPVPSYDGVTAWGMALPTELGTKLSLDILTNGNKAVVLVTDGTTDTTPYQVYQLHIFPTTPKARGSAVPYPEHRPYTVLATCIAAGAVESCHRLWLASTSFSFDLILLREGNLDLRLLDYMAILGVSRTSTGQVDALAISSDAVVAVGEVCAERTTVVVDLWGADRTEHSIAWTFQLSNGKLKTWKLAVPAEPAEHIALAEELVEKSDESQRSLWVHPRSRLLGRVCPTESTSSWMQGSGRMTSSELFLGRMPGDRFGYGIAAGQSCRPMHRQLGEDFESEIFLSDFLQNEVMGPGDITLLPPPLLSSLYMSILDGDDLQQYLGLPSSSERDRSVIILALRLLIFVSVDRLATCKPMSVEARSAQAVFRSAVSIARELLGNESLPFAAFIIELARQMEPSRFVYFLPLPSPEGYSIDRLLEIAALNGSIGISMAALPLLTNKLQARAFCATTLRICITACMKPQSVPHTLRREASQAVSDLFRFGLKLEDLYEDPEEYAADSFDASIDSDFFFDDEVHDEEAYSVFCGIRRFFGGRKTERRNGAYVDHAFRSSGTRPTAALVPANASTYAEGVTDVVAETLQSLLLDVSHLMLWGSAARLASLLLQGTLAGLPQCSKEECGALLEDTAARPIRHVLPKVYRRKDGLVDFFSAAVSRCMDCLDDEEISNLVNLLRINLRPGSIMGDRQSEHTATLLLVLLVLGHVSGNLANLVEVEKMDHHLAIESLLKATASTKLILLS
jgi:hypothetical protein